MEDSADRNIRPEVGAVGSAPSGSSDVDDRQDLVTVDEIFRSDAYDSASPAEAANHHNAEQPDIDLGVSAFADDFTHGNLIQGAGGVVCRHRQRNRRRGTRVNHFHHHHCPTQSCAQHQELLASHARLEDQVASLQESHRQLSEFAYTSVGQINRNLVEVTNALTEFTVRVGANIRAQDHGSPSPPRPHHQPPQDPSRWEPVEVVRTLREFRERAFPPRRSLSPARRAPSPARRLPSPARRAPLLAHRPSSPASRRAASPARHSSLPARRSAARSLQDVDEAAADQFAAAASAAPVPRPASSASRSGSPPSPSSLAVRVDADFEQFSERVRRNTRGFFVAELVRVKELHPNLEAERGWIRLVYRVMNTGPYNSPDEVDRAWVLAFERPARSHFRRFWETPIGSLRAALPESVSLRHRDLIRF